jgi:hypothetical protein
VERLAMDKHSNLLRKPLVAAVISFMIQAPGFILVKHIPVSNGINSFLNLIHPLEQ